MEKYEKMYDDTIKAYKNLGKEYLDKINALVPKQIYFFMENLKPGGKVLDVGCAGGRESKILAERGFDVTGIDMVEEFLDEARKNVPGARFQKMDLLQMDFPPESFDGIWASAVLLHIRREDIPRALKNFSDVLKPKGKLFVAVKLGQGQTYMADDLSDEKRLMVLYSKEEISKFVTDAGFALVYIEITPDDAGREDIKWVRLIVEKS